MNNPLTEKYWEWGEQIISDQATSRSQAEPWERGVGLDKLRTTNYELRTT